MILYINGLCILCTHLPFFIYVLPRLHIDIISHRLPITIRCVQRCISIDEQDHILQQCRQL